MPELDDNLNLGEPSAASTSDEKEGLSDEDYMQLSSIHFNKRQYNNLPNTLETEKYYVISYGKDLGYVRKVTKIGKTKVTMKFLTRKLQEMYNFPIKEM